jgi:hypothetical protein
MGAIRAILQGFPIRFLAPSIADVKTQQIGVIGIFWIPVALISFANIDPSYTSITSNENFYTTLREDRDILWIKAIAMKAVLFVPLFVPIGANQAAHGLIVARQL